MLVSFDEGGLRVADGERRDYFPFAVMASVELKPRALRRPAVAALNAAGESSTVFVGPEALEVHRALIEHLEARRRRTPAAGPAHWRRGDRDLSAWLAAVRSEDMGTYRDGSFVPIALAVFEDADAEVEPRAAAAHLLVQHATGADLVRVAKTLASRPLPPLVQLAARIAEGGPHLVSESAFAEATSFVSEADREGARAVTPSGSDRHAAAAAQAKSELAAEASHARASAQQHHERHRKAAGADRDTSRWIGKTWGF